MWESRARLARPQLQLHDHRFEGAEVKRSKAYRAAVDKMTPGKVYGPLEAVRLAKETSATKYDACLLYTSRCV